MALPSTVIDDDTATTYVVVPCQHCNGDGISFVTVEEIRAAFITVGRRFADELAELGEAS